MAFQPDWRLALLVLQAVPYFGTMGDRIRWRSEGEAVLPVHLLSLLDYTRNAPSWERAGLYAPCLAAMTDFPALKKQILPRLRDDARVIPIAEMVDLLREASRVRPSEAYFDVVNDLWTRNAANTAPGVGGRGMIIALVRALRQKWPDAELNHLNASLRATAFGGKRAG